MSRRPTKTFVPEDSPAKARPRSSKDHAPKPKKSHKNVPTELQPKSKPPSNDSAFKKPAVKTEPSDAPPQKVAPISPESCPPPSSAPVPVQTPTRLNRRSISEGNLLDRARYTKDVSPAITHELPTREAPATPIPRISLSQLMDDNRTPAPAEVEVSPGEKIGWGAATPRRIQFTPMRRSKGDSSPSRDALTARRRSSSPDPQESAWKTTPVMDPASQLWSKYKGARQSAPDGEHSVNSGALYSASQGADRSPSLRRSNTFEAPKHRVKRRKTTGFEQLHDGDVMMNDSGSTTAAPTPRTKSIKKARVNSLADKLKEKMSRRPASLLPPYGLSRTPSPEHQTLAVQQLTPATTAATSSNDMPALRGSDDEDYGDLDIDMDLYESLEQAATQQCAVQAQQQLAVNADADDDDEYFGEMDDDTDLEELVSKYDAPTQEASPQTKAFQAEFRDLQAEDFSDDIAGKRHIKRYQVAGFSEEKYEGKNQIMRPQRILTVRDERSKVTCRIVLRDSWYRDTDITEGDIVHLVGSLDCHNTCIVDDARNLLVIHPDFLVSSTTVADTVRCMRLAVLQERVKATGDISQPMVYGNILHTLLQMALEANDFSNKCMFTCIDELVVRNIESLYALNEDVGIATTYLRSKVPLIQTWAGIFVSAKPKAEAKVADHNSENTPVVGIKKLLDIEEHVWSPMYGLKGMIDATVEATIVDNGKARTLTIPLELKTGQSSKVMQHRAQTMLYTLLMADRYDVDVQCGMLYYLEKTEMIRVPAIRNELRSMIQNRNRVASYMRNRETLPDVLAEENTCGRCYAKESCFIYHKLLEDGTAESSGVRDFSAMTDHLGEKHKSFFKHWDGLLTKEDRDSVRFRREIWTMLSSQREAAGRCFGNLVILPGSTVYDKYSAKINKYTYSFSKKASPSGFTFFDSQISTGEPIVISDECGHYALAIGYVAEITKNRITVQVDRRLHNARTRQPGFNETNNQVFNGIVEVRNAWSQGSAKDYEDDQILYRIDKDEYSNGMAMVRNNLICLMSAQSEGKHRRLIVELEAPNFKHEPTAYQLPDTASQANLNVDQRRAIETVMSAQDYALILGMPGTGKTTTIVHIIRALISQGKSVLLTSYTHTAVDNILLKIRKDNIEILRLGSKSKIHPEVHEFAALAETSHKSSKEFHDAIHGPKVVATTCLGVNHPVFQERTFDYCIVDEASQITLPVCIGPIRFARTFILVGDHYQLPPLVRDPEARNGGLDVSLFKLLSDAHPQAVVNLTHQYRMCEEIMTLSNELIYKGMLKCGTEQVARSTLRIPNSSGLQRLHAGEGEMCRNRCWMRDLFAEDVKAQFVDTDLIPATEERMGDRIGNPVEAELVYQLVEGFLHTGVAPSSIGVISVYRSQLKLIQHRLPPSRHPHIEMHTADKFQGRDKDIIIISLVRSNTNQNVGELLRDWRRINVAFTRARTKLIILGSKSTLMESGSEVLSGFVRLVEERGWCYSLPQGADKRHRVPNVRTQVRVTGDGGEVAKEKENSLKGPRRAAGRDGLVQKRISGERSVLRDILNAF